MVTVVGSTTLDVLVGRLSRMPEREGDEFTDSSLVYTDSPTRLLLGGNGANTAYCLAHLGTDAHLSSAVGRDEAGDLLLGWLEEGGVSLSGVVRSKEAATSSTTVVTDGAGNRLSYHHHGSTGAFTADDLSRSMLDRSEALLVTGPSLLTGWRMEGIAEILRAAADRDLVTALDLGPAIGDPVVRSELAPVLPDVDLLFANAYELSVCTGREEREVSTSAARCLRTGAGSVVVKRGPEGAELYRPPAAGSADGRRSDDGAHPSIDAAGPAHRVDALPVEAASTVGAGDSFNAGFLHAYLGTGDPGRALEFANAYAARIVEGTRGTLAAREIGAHGPSDVKGLL